MKNKLLMKYPASWWGAKWREALPAGNGPIGAAVYGAIHDETVLLTHEKLWHKVITQELPDVSHILPETRRLLADKMVHAGEKLIADELTRQEYNPDIGYPLPLGDLKIKMPVSRGFRNYRRELNMETGEVSVQWQDNKIDYQRRLFVSRDQDIVVMEILSNGDNLTASITLDLHDHHDTRTLNHGQTPLPKQLEVSANDDGFIHYAALNDDGHDFGAVARVFSKNGRLTADHNDHSIYSNDSNNLIIVLKLFTHENRQDAWARLEKELENTPMDYDELLTPHASIHSELFNRVTLDLGTSDTDHKICNEELLLDAYQGDAPTPLIEKMWAYGRYLLISSSRDGGHPCHLYGNWFGEYRGYWAFNMANENLQMIYWQALSGGLQEAILPVFNYYDSMMDDFRKNAKHLFGCGGIYIPAVTTPPSGLLKTVRPHIIHWTGAAAWIAHHYYDYFLYTRDKTFLRERALPFLRETVQFYKDFFTIDEEGYYLSSPSNSPENTPGNYYDGKGMGQAMETTMNATMDFALAKEAITHLIEGSEILEINHSDIPQWKQMLKRIRPYQINEEGAVKEWMHPFFEDNYHHRHQSHIYPLFPGREINRDDTPELFSAFETAIDKRHVVGLSEQTGWSLVHMANVYSRLLNGDQALDCLSLIARSCVKNNFYTTHNDWREMGIGVKMEWAPFQIDANMGWTAAVQQMLMHSRPGLVAVLPALPSHWQKGSVKGLMTRGNIRINITWDISAGIISVDLTSIARDQEITLRSHPVTERKIAVTLTADTPQTISINLNE